MGWFRYPKDGQNDVLSTSDELREANQFVKKIRGVARFGYQIPAYSLARDRGGDTFSGLVFPGTQTQMSSIWNSVNWLRQEWGKDIESNFSGVDFFNWLAGLFNYRGDASFDQILHGKQQRIKIFRKDLKEPDGAVGVFGIPAIDTQFYGYPPYSAQSGRPSRSLTFVRFNDPKSKAEYEKTLISHKSPLRLQNAVHSVLFSPDVTTNLVGINSSKGFNFVVRDTQPQAPYYSNVDSALSDFAGLGFDYPKSAAAGGNNTPLVE